MDPRQFDGIQQPAPVKDFHVTYHLLPVQKCQIIYGAYALIERLNVPAKVILDQKIQDVYSPLSGYIMLMHIHSEV
jgi:hypothetical protein